MTVCDWCFITLFDDDRWIRERWKDHHRTCASWANSIKQPCTVCVALLERTRATLEDPGQLYKDDVNPEMGQRSYSDILLDWLERNEHKINPSMPLYRVQMQEGGARHEWLLRFVPSAINDSGPPLPNQKFVIYGAYYDKEEGRDERPPKIGNSTASDTTFTRLKSWLDDCAHNHPACSHLNDISRKKYGTFMPTRVIDVISNRLIETQTSNIAAPYMTLSHCWGGEPSHQLTDTTLPSYLISLPFPSLPLTFQHAMTITSRLGIRYLWIDSLCIIQQQPEPKPDWSAEAPNMAKVYGNSFCNIAAVSSYNSKQGIFRPRRIAGLAPSLVRVRWSGQNVLCRVVRDDFWSGEVLSEPLYTRGWVFQERMLSPRILHFHRKQVFWQCLSLTACESLPRGLSRVVDDERGDELRWRQILHRERTEVEEMELVDLSAIWRVAVRSYTGCSLTFRTDKLIALASIASAVQDLLSERYVAGMWGGHASLVDELAWKVEKWYESKSWDWISVDEYRAPSWSWASLDAVVRVPARIKHEYRNYALDINHGAVHLDLKIEGVSTGPITSGRMNVRGRLFRVAFTAATSDAKTWIWQSETKTENAVVEEGDENSVSNEFCQLTLDSLSSLKLLRYGDDNELSMPGDGTPERLLCSVLILSYETDPSNHLFQGYALALRPIVGAGTYSRVGLVEFRSFPMKPEDAFSADVGSEDEFGRSEESITLI